MVRDERGDIMLRGLVKLVVFILALALVVHEAVAIAVNHVQLDDIGRDAVLSGAAVPSGQRTPAHVERAVLASLDEHEGARLEAFAADREAVRVTVGRTANVLVLDRLGPLSSWSENSVTKQAVFR